MPATRFRKFTVEFPAKLTKEEKHLMAKYETLKKNKAHVNQMRKKKVQGKKLMDLVYGNSEEEKKSAIEKIIVIPPNKSEDREFQKPICRKPKEEPKQEPAALPHYTSYDDIALTEHPKKKQKFEPPKRRPSTYTHNWDEPEKTEMMEEDESEMKQERELVIYDGMELFE